MSQPSERNPNEHSKNRLRLLLQEPRRTSSVDNMLLTKFVLEKDQLEPDQIAAVQKAINSDRSVKKKYLSLKKQSCFLKGRSVTLTDV